MPAFAGMTDDLFTALEAILSILRQFKPPNASSEIPWTVAKIRDPTERHICPDDADP
jgi:hypothetical protein